MENLPEQQKIDMCKRMNSVKDEIKNVENPWEDFAQEWRPPIHDDEDGVTRCPACNWEVLLGRCVNCGIFVEESIQEMESDPYEILDHSSDDDEYISDGGFVVNDDDVDNVTQYSEDDSDSSPSLNDFTAPHVHFSSSDQNSGDDLAVSSAANDRIDNSDITSNTSCPENFGGNENSEQEYEDESDQENYPEFIDSRTGLHEITHDSDTEYQATLRSPKTRRIARIEESDSEQDDS